MIRLAVILLSFLIIAVGLVRAQQSAQMRPGEGGPFSVDSSGNITITPGVGAAILSPGRTLSTGTAPTVTSCGGDPTIAGSDTAGLVTVGATPSTGCVITFTRAYGAAPACLVTWASGPLASMSWTVSTTAITVTQTSTASNRLQYICIGKS